MYAVVSSIFRWFTCLTAAAAVLLLVGVCQADDLEDANNAWKARIGKIKSAEFHLEKKSQKEAGYMNRVAKRLGIKGDVPAEAEWTSCRETIIRDGNRLRYDFDGYNPIVGQDDVVLTKRSSVYDGVDTKTLRYIEGTERPSQGTIDSGRVIPVTMVRGYTPVWWFLGSAGKAFDLSKGARVVPGFHKKGDEEPARELIVEIQRTPTSSIMLWLDKSRDYVPVTYSGIRNSAVAWQLDVEYERNDIVDWVPSKWTYVSIVPGDHRSYSDWKVVSFSLNADVPPNIFSITFPEGTLVCDARGDREDMYIVGKNEAKQPLKQHNGKEESTRGNAEGEAESPDAEKPEDEEAQLDQGGQA